MKKSIYVILAAVCMSLSGCAKDKIIPFEQLPAAAQQVVNEHFAVENVAYVTMDRELFSKEYEVRFNDGAELKFEGDGSLEKVDCKLQAVPDALIPAAVLEYVKTQFPQAFIVEWSKNDMWGWKAELNNKLDLKFNRNFEFIGIDD